MRLGLAASLGMGLEMTGRVTKPGVYHGIAAADYHGDLCPGPSISSSGAKLLVEASPATFWQASYLNPDQESENKTEFDLGAAAHVALLEPGTWEDRIILVEADDYKTKDARAARDAAWAAGKTPLLPKHHVKVAAMREALRRHPITQNAWHDGYAEPTYVWQPSTPSIWLKARPDFVPKHGNWIIDYKTTTSVHPDTFQRRAFDLGYHIQAAWNMRAVEAVTGRAPDDFFLVAQETTPPYLVVVFRLSPRALEWGGMICRRAIDLFAECVAKNRWPGYSDAIVDLELPTYAEFRLNERLEGGEFSAKPSAAALQFAREAQAP